MPVLTLRLFDLASRPLRTETLEVDSALVAIDTAQARVRASRFRSATIHLDGVYLRTVGREDATWPQLQPPSLKSPEGDLCRTAE